MYKTAACSRAVYAHRAACQQLYPFARAQSSRYPDVVPRHHQIKGRLARQIIKIFSEDNI
jgi:hypothetical protein